MGRLIGSLLISIGIFGTIAGIAYLFYENEKLKEKIKELTQQNDHYQDTNLKLINEIKKLKRKNRTLAYQLRSSNYKWTKNTHKTKKYTSNQKQKRKIVKMNITPSKNNKNNPLDHVLSKQPRKYYHRYTGYTKLKSDLKIKIRPDNRFVSNQPIYGWYRGRIYSAVCGKEKRIYKIENECRTLAPNSLDPLYFSKSYYKDLRTYNTKDHMIECRYSQKYGIMHDCKPKLYRYVFR